MRQKETTTHRAPAHSAGNPSGSLGMFAAHGTLIPTSGFSRVELEAAKRICRVMDEGERARGDPHRRKSLFMVGSSTARRLADLGHAGLEPIAEIAGSRAVFAHLAQENPDFGAARETAEALGLKPSSVRDALSEAVSFFHQHGKPDEASQVWARGLRLLDEGKI